MNFLENESSAKCFLSKSSSFVERENTLQSSVRKLILIGIKQDAINNN